MKKYCPSCGKQNQVGAKFCCFCGSAISLVKKGQIKASVDIDHGEDDEEDEDFSGGLSASKLDVVIQHYQPPTETLGAIMGTGGEPALEEHREGGSQVSSKEFMEEFRREAGPLHRGHEKEN